MAEGRQRIDKWLFFARVAKSRSLGARLAVGGRIRINRDKATQAADLVKPGDVLTITLERRIIIYKVLAPGTRRGPADEARLLYEDLTPPPERKADAAPSAVAAPRDAGSGRPTKKQRRDTDRLREGE
jgi:ribosome-associated heat shock protein Hsp15